MEIELIFRIKLSEEDREKHEVKIEPPADMTKFTVSQIAEAVRDFSYSLEGFDYKEMVEKINKMAKADEEEKPLNSLLGEK